MMNMMNRAEVVAEIMSWRLDGIGVPEVLANDIYDEIMDDVKLGWVEPHEFEYELWHRFNEAIYPDD